nr:hypothetical protein [Saccharopolyspora hordei]
MLSAALRAHAGGSPGAVPPPPAPPPPRRERLPVAGVLLFAIVLGLATGAVAAAVTLLGSPLS